MNFVSDKNLPRCQLGSTLHPFKTLRTHQQSIQDVASLAQPESGTANSPLADLGSSEMPTPVVVPSEPETDSAEAQSDLRPIPHSPTLQYICEEDVALEMDEYELDGMGGEDLGFESESSSE